MGHRLCSRELPDKFLCPQMALGRDSGDVRVFKRMVLKGRLAPFYPGFEDSDAAPGVRILLELLEECPICYMYYRVMNRTKCCRQRICSECIAQIQSSNGTSLSSCPCPFCKKSGIHVEVCGCKTEVEKEADRLEEQKFEEFCSRQRGLNADVFTESHTCSRPDPPTQSNNPRQSAQSETRCINSGTRVTGESSSAAAALRGIYDAPRTVQDEYRQEYEALSRTTGTMSSELSHLEMRHCSEYLGVNPEDLGLHLDEFNELMLEQVLISSMLETREDEQGEEEHEEEEEDLLIIDRRQLQNPSLRSHCLPQEDLNEEDSSHGEEHHRRQSSVEVLAQQLASSDLLSFSSQSGGGGVGGLVMDSNVQQQSRPQNEGSSATARQEEEQQQEIDSSSRSSADSFGTVWGNFLNSLAGIGDRHFRLQIVLMKFDEAQLSLATNDQVSSCITACLKKSISCNKKYRTSQLAADSASEDADFDYMFKEDGEGENHNMTAAAAENLKDKINQIR
eukprot:g3964.t1